LWTWLDRFVTERVGRSKSWRSPEVVIDLMASGDRVIYIYTYTCIYTLPMYTYIRSHHVSLKREVNLIVRHRVYSMIIVT